MTDITIGLAGAGDLEWCAGVMASTDPWITLGRDFAACLKRCRSAELVVLLARRHGERCGFVLLHPTGLAGSPYIASIAVSAEARGHGVGEAMLAAAERWFPEARHMFLLVSSFNTRAQQFYLRHGYAQVGDVPDYVIRGASELILHKRLVQP